MKQRKVTYKQLMSYIEQLEIQVRNNERAVYDMSQVLTDYVEMRGKSKRLNRFMKKKHLGSSAEIESVWKRFFKSIKDKYLQLKKTLVFKK